MKKIYALIASVAIGGMISASAQYLAEKPVKQFGQPKQIDLTTLKHVTKPVLNTMKAPSRADEVANFDITKCTQFTYYDYYANWYDYPADAAYPDGLVERDTFRYILSSNEVSYEVKDNEIIIDNMFGLDNEGMAEYYPDYVAPTMYYNDEGQLMFKLGKVFSDTAYDLYYAAVISDAEGKGKSVLEGEIPMTIENGSWYFDGLLGLYVDYLSNPNYSGFDTLYAAAGGDRPNAVFEYTAYLYSGETISDENNVCVSYIAPDEDDENPAPYFMVSNVSPFNAGTAVYFGLLEENDEILAIAYNQVVDLSGYTKDDEGNNICTGDFYWYTFNMDDSEAESLEIDATYTEIDEYSFKIEWEDYTTFFSGSFYYGVVLYPGSITVNFGDTSGIKSAIADEANGPAEYYNLQGVKVANPSAGQIYIVKEGNKVRKQIIR